MSVNISCSVIGGVILVLDATVVKLAGPPVFALNPGYGSGAAGVGVTSVDEDFWTVWTARNADSALLSSGAIVET